MTEQARPSGMLGMRHVALFVEDLEACLHFYVDLLGMQVEWNPDPENYYLTSGSDNLALHRSAGKPAESGQRLDHIGFIIRQPQEVDAWHDHLVGNGVKILQPP
ncbi:MAG TPA: VOC family protein, partial [Methylophilaceae bacterium]|nr:VOC family protein [Methylophilaceae bacterium]